MLPEIPAKTRATAELLNRVIRQANRVDRISVDGQEAHVGPAGIDFRMGPSGRGFVEGAQRCVLVNRDPDRQTIPAFGVAAILTASDDWNASTRNSTPGILETRGFHVQHAATGSDGQLVVAAERIEHGAAGIGYCAGVTACLINDDTRAAIVAAGNPTILHEEVDEAGEVKTGDRLHWAVVRFGGGGQTLTRILIGGNNQSYNKEFAADPGKRGLVGSTSDLQSVSIAYDPANPVAIVEDGVGYGESEAGDNVLVVSRRVVVGGVVRGGGVHQYNLYNGVAFTAWRRIAIPVSGANRSISAWEVYLLG